MSLYAVKGILIVESEEDKNEIVGSLAESLPDMSTKGDAFSVVHEHSGNYLIRYVRRLESEKERDALFDGLTASLAKSVDDDKRESVVEKHKCVHPDGTECVYVEIVRREDIKIPPKDKEVEL